MAGKKILSVILCMSGVFVVAYSGSGEGKADGSGPENVVLGDTMAVLSAVFMALYTVCTSVCVFFCFLFFG